MGLIKLRGMDFHAYHGVYPKEREIGNRFQVNLCVDFPFERLASEDDLEKTLDYDQLYQVVAGVMRQQANLIEHLAHKIAERIQLEYPQITGLTVEVRKYNPPINGSCEYAAVEVTV